MGELVKALDGVSTLPVLIAGDFNTPAGSSLLDQLRSGGFRDGFEEAGWGFGYTWPSLWPAIRIDQVYASRGWTFHRCWAGPAVGSDHLPVIAVLSFPTPQGGGLEGVPRIVEK